MDEEVSESLTSSDFTVFSHSLAALEWQSELSSLDGKTTTNDFFLYPPQTPAILKKINSLYFVTEITDLV